MGFLEKSVYFKLIKLSESYFVWIGLEPLLSNMAVAMPTKFSSTPSSTLLFGNKSELGTSSLAQKLAKKFNKQIFVSCSVPYDQQLSVLLEKRLSQAIKEVES